MFAQPFDHSFNDLFNQYVNMESSSVDGNKDVSFTGGDLDQFFPLDSLSSDCGDISPSGSTSKRSRRSSQPWGQDLWGVPQDTGAASSSSEQGSFPSQDTIQPSAVSDLSFAIDASSASSQPAATQGLLSSTAPSTPPHTPRKKACTGSGITTPISNRHPRDTNARRNQLRKHSFSPSLMRTSQTPKGRMAYSDASAQRFHSFSFRSSDDHLPLSPPPSDILVQQENNLATTTDSNNNNHHQNNARSADHFTGNSGDMSHQYDPSVFNQSPAISMPSPSANALARQQQKYMNQQSNNSNPGLTSSSPSADEIFSPPHSSASQSLSSWYSDSLGASSFSFPSDFSSGPESQAWWSPMGSRVPTQRQQSYQQQQQQQQPVIASPAPQRPIQSHPEHQNDMFQGGLMIQFDQSFDMSGSADTSFASSSAPAATSAMAAVHDTTASSMPSYNQMPTTPQKFINPTFTTPQMPHSQSSHSSPSLSPKTPRGHTRSPRNKFSATPSHPRTTAVTRTPNTRHSYEGKMSMSSTPMSKPTRTPGSSGSMKGSNKSLSVSFVNFTPSDSKKILTGVAPSGSSKTKARREQEARDRRRKLSEAAMMAIRNAGGDIDSLEAILC